LEEFFMNMKKTVLASSIVMALGSSSVYAAAVNDLFGPYNFNTVSANFTMLNPNGYIVGGTNDVVMAWDGNGFTDSSDYTGLSSVANVTASSTTLFFAQLWTAHNIQVFVPGSYSFDTAVTGGNGANGESGIMSVTVGAGQMGMHMLFDWNGNNNIDVFVVASPSSVYGSGVINSSNTKGCGGGFTKLSQSASNIKNCLWDGAGYVTGATPVTGQVWMLATIDGNADGVMGIPMAAGGPFQFFNAGFNATMTATPDPVPVPAAAWLLGSGLLGLVGVSRRKGK
jgi:hypothetical protein